MRSQINLNEMMLLAKNFEIINKTSYAFHLFEQKRQNNNMTIISAINSKIEENLNIIIKELKCYNYDKIDHKAFVYPNEHVFDQNFLN